MYTPAHYSVLQAARDELRTMVERRQEELKDSPHVRLLFVDFLRNGTLGDDAGRWHPRFAGDPGHPNDAGHAAMASVCGEQWAEFCESEMSQ